MNDRQQRADAVDREMAVRLLPDAVVQALIRWWERNAHEFADGTPGMHTVRYTPARWVSVTPWPSALAPTSASGDATVSRKEVAAAVADALQRSDLREALVASYVWGKGKRGTPAGSGPTTLIAVLGAGGLDAALASALAVLRTQDSQHAYAELEGKVRGFGPAFFTKFLYFAAAAVPPALGPRPLILDSVLAGRMRSMAEVVGRDTGHDPHGKVAAWVWSEGGWTPHRYQVYLSFMDAAARQMAATNGWPSHANPDLLEYGLFNTTWKICS
ncbi:8-oxoguanine DNA glycosylase OGG fold protein [Actinacidiphila acidipaludis]|uniref:Uncharacterized protein n=1 Tax=Actinacidiphila acidipaludis TaxID=2873382 RepID=A0ABS7QHR9_9ACTN|nr:hypothetical protein [Streptomyces acidipaludis]MBY8882731.1 hypothetical protein [Streptomyces acidipaludis]